MRRHGSQCGMTQTRSFGTSSCWKRVLPVQNEIVDVAIIQYLAFTHFQTVIAVASAFSQRDNQLPSLQDIEAASASPQNSVSETDACLTQSSVVDWA